MSRFVDAMDEMLNDLWRGLWQALACFAGGAAFGSFVTWMVMR